MIFCLEIVLSEISVTFRLFLLSLSAFIFNGNELESLIFKGNGIIRRDKKIQRGVFK